MKTAFWERLEDEVVIRVGYWRVYEWLHMDKSR